MATGTEDYGINPKTGNPYTLEDFEGLLGNTFPDWGSVFSFLEGITDSGIKYGSGGVFDPQTYVTGENIWGSVLPDDPLNLTIPQDLLTAYLQSLQEQNKTPASTEYTPGTSIGIGSGYSAAQTLAGGLPFEDVVAPGLSFGPEAPMGTTEYLGQIIDPIDPIQLPPEPTPPIEPPPPPPPDPPVKPPKPPQPEPPVGVEPPPGEPTPTPPPVEPPLPPIEPPVTKPEPPIYGGGPVGPGIPFPGPYEPPPSVGGPGPGPGPMPGPTMPRPGPMQPTASAPASVGGPGYMYYPVDSMGSVVDNIVSPIRSGRVSGTIDPRLLYLI